METRPQQEPVTSLPATGVIADVIVVEKRKSADVTTVGDVISAEKKRPTEAGLASDAIVEKRRPISFVGDVGASIKVRPLSTEIRREEVTGEEKGRGMRDSGAWDEEEDFEEGEESEIYPPTWRPSGRKYLVSSFV